jgi:hypothetical protein
MRDRSPSTQISLRRAAAVAALFAASFALPLAASAASPAAGTWELSMDLQGNAVPATLTITEVDGKLGGTWSTARGTSELSSVSFDDGKLVAKWTRDFQGQSVELTYEGTISGDAITGQMVSPRGAIAASGKRAGAGGGAATTSAAPATGKGAAVGTWKVTSVSQLGSLERTLVVNADGTGTYSTADASYPLSNVAMDGNHLRFDVTVSAQGQELPLHFEGDVDGDAISGKFSSDAAGGEVATVTGKRQ